MIAVEFAKVPDISTEVEISILRNKRELESMTKKCTRKT